MTNEPTQWTSGAELWGAGSSQVATTEADVLTAERFQSHVDESRPLLVRNALASWPAVSRWADRSHLRTALGGREFVVHRRPVPEMKWRRETWPERFGNLTGPGDGESLDFAAFEAAATSDEFVFTYAVELDETTSLGPLADDAGDFHFLPRPAAPRYYGRLRAFLHGRSYTDWHVHPNDETLMCQFGVRKRVSLLPPTQRTWDVLIHVARQETYLGPASPDEHPDLRTLSPIVLDVRPGDALYIPPHWWHAVECPTADGGIGVTVAYCWGSPLHIRLDPRFPVKRFRSAHASLPKRAKLALGRLAWLGLRCTGRNVPQLA